MLTKTSLSLSCLLLVCGVHRARAGQWVVDHYERSGTTSSQTLNHGRDPVVNAPILTSVGTADTVTKWTPEGEKSTLNGVETTEDFVNIGAATVQRVNSYNGSLYTEGLKGGKAEATLDVVAVLHWERNTIHDPTSPDYNEDYDEGHPDPNDDPPKFVWIIERAGIFGYEGTGRDYLGPNGTTVPYNEQHPYANSEFKFSGIVHPFGLQYTGTTPHAGYYGSWMTGQFNLSDRRVQCVEATGDTVRVRQASFKAHIDLPATTEDDVWREAWASVYFDYDVQVATLAVLARLKGKNKPEDLSTDYSYNWTQGGSSASIAAGHIVNDDHLHEADIALQVLEPNSWGGLDAVAGAQMPFLPEMEVVNKAGVVKDLSLEASDAPATDRLSTNDRLSPTDRSAGRIALGKVTARDLVTDWQNGITVRPKTTTGSGAGIGESWADVEWKMGDDSNTQWDDLEDWDDARDDDAKWVYAKLTGISGKPLAGHTLKFLVNYLEVSSTDPDTGVKTIKIFTTDSMEASQYANNSTYRVVCQDDLTSVVSQYIIAPAQATSDSNGIVKGQATIKSLDHGSIESYGLSLEDQDVYHKID